jgi:hypothetical protein
VVEINRLPDVEGDEDVDGCSDEHEVGGCRRSGHCC